MKAIDYPDDTWGSRAAREARKAANKFTEKERRRLLKKAMRLIDEGKSNDMKPPKLKKNEWWAWKTQKKKKTNTAYLFKDYPDAISLDVGLSFGYTPVKVRIVEVEE